MDQNIYPYATNETLLNFEFASEGPRGKIRKIVRYSPQNSNGITYFNLAFGDWNENLQRIDDGIVSNNSDRQIVLATVASTILDVTSQFPDIPVYARGSTAARTRLYQMGIAANREFIDKVFVVYGLTKGEWQHFQKNVNYEAFFVVRKK